ncbi:MAG TPA: carboxypeptidase-like regulatory domain-containing protein [Thermoanaerobaculia bacterium]|nr:carboxypeptidase-like regulatory domain-containing protein [Thermoanaerobaculia bacterium]
MRYAVLTALLILAAPLAFAGTFTGTILDAATKKPLPNATVAAVGPEGHYTTTTAEDGTYTLADVNPGTYDFSASAAGFKPFTRSGVRIGTMQTLRLNAELLPEPAKDHASR